jgi:hypothetical protein
LQCARWIASNRFDSPKQLEIMVTVMPKADLLGVPEEDA